MKRLLAFLFVILLATPSQAVLLLDGNVPPGCTVSAGTLTCTGFVGSGAGLTSLPASDGNDTEITRLAAAEKANALTPASGTSGTFGSLSIGTNDNATISDNGTAYITAIQLKRSATLDVCQEFLSSTGGTDYYRQYCAPPAGYATSNLRINDPTALPAAGQVMAFGAPVAGVSTKTFVLPALSPAASQITFAGPTQARTWTGPDAAATLITEGNASGGVILGDSTPDAAGELGYASTQLSVHDGTASRPLLQVASTTITKYQYLPAAWIEEIGTGPEDAAIISGEEIKARLFSDNDTSIVLWQVDPEWTAGLKFRVYYSLVANGEADDTATFRLSGCSIGNSEALTCTAGGIVGIDDEIGTDDDANELMVTGWSSEVTVTGIAAGELARLSFYRGTDDEAGDLNIIGIELKYQAKVSAATDY